MTWCELCADWVGVWASPFNKGDGRYPPQPKYTRHSHPGGSRCPNSGRTINPNLVMDRETA